MSALTAKQAQLLNYLKSRLAESEVAPSFEEMMVALGLKSKSGVHRLIEGLVERGRIRRLPNRARAIEIVENPTLETSLDLRRYTNLTLAKEARRRGLMLVSVQATYSPTTGARSSRFVEVTR